MIPVYFRPSRNESSRLSAELCARPKLVHRRCCDCLKRIRTRLASLKRNKVKRVYGFLQPFLERCVCWWKVCVRAFVQHEMYDRRSIGNGSSTAGSKRLVSDDTDAGALCRDCTDINYASFSIFSAPASGLESCSENSWNSGFPVPVFLSRGGESKISVTAAA